MQETAALAVGLGQHEVALRQRNGQDHSVKPPAGPQVKDGRLPEFARHRQGVQHVQADGVVRDPSGYLELDIKKTQSDYIWIADDQNYGVGLVSKVHTKPYPNAPTYREVARYADIELHEVTEPGGPIRIVGRSHVHDGVRDDHGVVHSGIITALAGVIIGLPTLRLRGDYLAIVTLGFGEIIRSLLENTPALGGATGLSGAPQRTNFFWVFA